MKPSEYLREKANKNGIVYPKITVSEALELNNKGYEDDIAIDYYGKKITYRELFQKRDEYAKAFLNYGVNKGDCVSACLGTLPETIYIFYALNKIGAKFYPILPMFNTEQIVNALKENNSNIILTLDSLYNRAGDAIVESGVPFKIKVSAYSSLPPMIKQIKIFSEWLKGNSYKDIPSDFITTNDFLNNGKDETLKACEWFDGKVAAVTSSAGSTGLNKPTALTDFGFNAMVENYKRALPRLNPNVWIIMDIQTSINSKPFLEKLHNQTFSQEKDWILYNTPYQNMIGGQSNESRVSTAQSPRHVIQHGILRLLSNIYLCVPKRNRANY